MPTYEPDTPVAMDLVGIPDPVLKDLLKTLRSDVVILVGSWSFNPKKETVHAFALKKLGLGTPTKPTVKACGCLMMDGHVDEFWKHLDDNGYSERHYFSSSLFLESEFLSKLYTRKCKASKNYRNYVVERDHIDSWAHRFDNYARQVQYMYSDGGGVKEIQPYQEQWLETTTRLLIKLNDAGRKHLIESIKAQLKYNADERANPVVDF